MSRVANPYDNAKAERFMRKLKDGEVDGATYADIAEARARIGPLIENVYNTRRLHSTLGYKPPVEFENELRRIGNAWSGHEKRLSLKSRVSPMGCSSVPRTSRTVAVFASAAKQSRG